MPEQESPNPHNEITRLNDQFRTTFKGGHVFMTLGIQALPDSIQQELFAQVKAFNNFSENNDPYGEHDFGMLELSNVGKIFWKIDYYDINLQYGSEDPADPTQTARVLTIMFSHEY